MGHVVAEAHQKVLNRPSVPKNTKAKEDTGKKNNKENERGKKKREKKKGRGKELRLPPPALSSIGNWLYVLSIGFVGDFMAT